MSDEVILSALRMKELYTLETGLDWNDDLGTTWCNKNFERLDGFRYRKVLQKDFFTNLSQKASIMAQTPCLLCGNLIPRACIPLRIKPESWQSLSPHRKQAFKNAIADRFKRQMPIEKLLGEVCISIIFVCSIGRRRRDIDNIGKLVLDSLKGVIMGDDKDVAHLSVARLDNPGTEEYMILTISNSDLNNDSNVIVPRIQHGWAGMEEMLIDDF